MAELIWHYTHGGVTHGPLPQAELCALFASKELPFETQVWNEGLADWVPASEVEDFRGIWGKGFAKPSATPPPSAASSGRPGLSPVAAAPSPVARLAPADAQPQVRVRMRPQMREDDEAPDDGPQARPWIRFWARHVDGWLNLSAFLFFLGIMPAVTPRDYLVYLSLFILGMLVVNVVLMATFGATVGKAILGISVETADRQRPGFGQCIGREFWAFVLGFGLCLPILSIIAPIVAYVTLKAEGTTSWDRMFGLVVRHQRVGFLRPVVALLVAVGSVYFGGRVVMADVREKLEAMEGSPFGIRRTVAAAEPEAPATQPTTRPAKKPKQKPKLLTLPSDNPATKAPIKSNSPTTRPLKRQDRPPSRVIFKPEPAPES